MISNRTDAAEATRNLLIEAAALARDARRLVLAADLLANAAASFGHGLLHGHPPDGHELLVRFGASIEATRGVASATDGLQAALESLRFTFADEPEPLQRLRARALDELRTHLGRTLNPAPSPTPR